MSTHFDQGSDDDHREDIHQHNHIASRFLIKDKPLGILTSTKHSLQPDMVFGWRPKLPSCPLPLKFANLTTQSLLPLISTSNLYKIAYKNKHFVSSVEVNQKYDYNWKYRSRYSLNLALIQQATKQQQQLVRNSSITNDHNNITTIPTITPKKQQQCQYTFSADFQSGNLDLAVRIKPNQYDCFLRSDSNTRGHCNWYYFSVRNHNRIGNVKINICNIGKIKNLYNKGMKPYVREFSSVEQQLQTQQLWSQQLCYDVEFVQRICRYGSEKKRFQLQFKYDFTKPNQEVFFAYAIPYTYSRLQKFIKQISFEQNKQLLVVEKLCESLGGLNIPLLKITNNASRQTQIQPNKKAVLLSARIHPGQSHSSYVMQGVIHQLLKKDYQHQILREMFVFYIVPMINVDGVVVGNYRTSYSGKDLNRQFKNLDIFVFPQITRLHELALEVRQKHFRGVQFYLDFHGHSSKKNLFAYGPDHSPKNIYFFKSRIFPKLIQDFHPIFSYKKSIFKISEGKKKTARAHMLWKLKIPMVYTFEVSNGMYETKNRENILLTSKILLDAGQAVMKGFFKYVKLEMKIPVRLMQKKVQKQNIIKKRIIKSSKGIRDSSIRLKRKSTKLHDIANHNNNIQFLSQKYVIDKQKRIHSRNQIGRTIYQQENQDRPQQQQMNQQAYENLEEFMNLIEEVKNIKLEEDVEGGSDSESDDEDLDKNQVDKLFKGIKNRKLLKQLKQHNNNKKTRKSKPKHYKSKQKKLLQDTSNNNTNNNNIFSQIKKQLKRYKNSQLEQYIKQSKKLTSQMSYVTLPSNSNKNPLIKSPSLNILNQKMTKVSARFYNNNNNAGGLMRENCQKGDKVVIRVPIVQKSFNLEI